uniref:Tuftelin-interacting protein 11 n=1 Tax=Schistosoma haematobium TaxID=6185 RepID=A0A094ZTB5_SCHHA
MGYEPGKGLGSDGRGIITPVQAVQRVGKVSVGYYGSEKAPAPRRGNETVVEGSDSDSLRTILLTRNLVQNELEFSAKSQRPPNNHETGQNLPPQRGLNSNGDASRSPEVNLRRGRSEEKIDSTGYDGGRNFYMLNQCIDDIECFENRLEKAIKRKSSYNRNSSGRISNHPSNR